MFGQPHHLIQGHVYNPAQGQGQFVQQPATHYSQSSMNVNDNGTLIELVQQMNMNFMTRLTSIEHSVSKLSTIESEMQYLKSGMSRLQSDNAHITSRLTEVENSCQGISNMFDDNRVATEKLNSEISNLKRENYELKSEAANFDDKCRKFENEISELKARSMQQNLLFFGLAEAPLGDTENPETKLRDFLRNELTMDDPNYINTIVFDRVHRIGRPKRYIGANPRPIVARFERFKDREIIRMAGKELNMKQNGYSIREQFPPEMEAKRKTLYPVMRRYAQNPQNHVVMVRDKLFINSEQYIPPTESNETADGQFQNRPSEVNSRGGERLNAGGRRFAQGIRARQQAQYNGVRTFNYYANLSVEQSDPTAEQMRGGKRALSSPEQDDTALKRSRELRAVPLCSIEDTEEMEILQGPGTDPGSVAQQTATADSIQLDVCSQPGTSSDSNAVNTVNTQTITVDVHYSPCSTDQADSINGENSITHEAPQ